MTIKIIAAVGAENFAIGKDGKMPWHYPDDLAHFKKITTDSLLVIMGRKTWESLGSKPLKNRFNIVLTRSNKWVYFDNACTNKSLNKAIIFCEIVQFLDVCVIGGSELYAEAMLLDNCKEAYITRVPDVVQDADTFFPQHLLIKYFTLESEKVEGKLIFQKWIRK